jgi:hypothetical protein
MTSGSDRRRVEAAILAARWLIVERGERQPTMNAQDSEETSCWPVGCQLSVCHHHQAGLLSAVSALSLRSVRAQRGRSARPTAHCVV